MPIFPLDESFFFPDPNLAEPDGFLAFGGDLLPGRLLEAYHQGIFPWFDGDLPLWYSPDPRFVLYPQKLKVSASMKSVIRKQTFTYTRNQAFTDVISNCRHSERPGQGGTWITEAMQKAYTELHLLGHALSAEAWQGGQLVGGLYGVKIGHIFFGESMFSKASNASKFAFIQLTEQLIQEGVQLIDCQVHTAHLESLGAEMIPRKQYLNQLKSLTRPTA